MVAARWVIMARDWHAPSRDEDDMRRFRIKNSQVARRLHAENASLLRPEALVEYTRIFRAHLGRRRAGDGGG